MKIIKIGAIWCPGCLVMKKIWNNILNNYDIDVMELDYDMDNEEVRKYDIGKVLPVVIFLDNNDNELERIVGEQTESKIVEMIEKYKVM